LQGEFNAIIRMNLKVKIKVIKGHVCALALCESSSFPNVPRAALAHNRDRQASENQFVKRML
jgi:hypothetical protein